MLWPFESAVVEPRAEPIEREFRIDRVTARGDTIQDGSMDMLTSARADFAVVCAGEGHQPLERIVQRVAVERDARIDFVADRIFVEVEQLVLGQKSAHPQKWYVGGTVVRISAADVRVDAGKPDLMDGLIHGGRLQIVPNRGLEGFALFVDRQTVEGILDMGPEGRIDEFIGVGTRMQIGRAHV